MELGKQIKKIRNEMSLSQDALAEKIYVSRQTISNWENDKSYPDVNSLILLSEVFETSIDILIKGDVEIMKEQVKNEDREEFEKLSRVYGFLFLLVVISPILLAHFLGYVGIVIWVALMVVAFYLAILLEKKKKQFDVQTYREIIAFTEGAELDEIAKAREEGKRPYQKVLLAIGAGVVTFVIAIIFTYVIKQRKMWLLDCLTNDHAEYPSLWEVGLHIKIKNCANHYCSSHDYISSSFFYS
ncbi:MAG: helix-turn-helix domain-containing protein [Syntrophaceticus sp.]|jgi:transcriptional regulator with XRE-family HTH domain